MATAPFLTGADFTGKIQSAEKYFSMMQISAIAAAKKIFFGSLAYFDDEMIFVFSIEIRKTGKEKEPPIGIEPMTY
ncbi:hypothetical protein [Pedobacter sp. UBA5917]|jgi:hypothetical protein|uniref:hypothetical protein n=1 Tax=Pedobacter sp. UBA5917 TaxID=1947061 RepID=UPI0025EB25B0|nr:hypothetical protein [Pedobacter sp. UBA5917]